jgi:hypothetical protein
VWLYLVCQRFVNRRTIRTVVLVEYSDYEARNLPVLVLVLVLVVVLGTPSTVVRKAVLRLLDSTTEGGDRRSYYCTITIVILLLPVEYSSTGSTR